MSKKEINWEGAVVQLLASGRIGTNATSGNLGIRSKGTVQRGTFLPSSSFFHVEGLLLEQYSCFLSHVFTHLFSPEEVE